MECGSNLRRINVAAGVKIYCANIFYVQFRQLTSRMLTELKICGNKSEYQNTRIQEYIQEFQNIRMYQTMCDNHIVTHAIDVKDGSRVKNCQKDKYVRIYQNTRIPENLNISYYINVTIYYVNILSHQQLHYGCRQS